MLDRDAGAVIEKTFKHEGEAVREFYASIPPPVLVGTEICERRPDGGVQ